MEAREALARIERTMRVLGGWEHEIELLRSAVEDQEAMDHLERVAQWSGLHMDGTKVPRFSTSAFPPARSLRESVRLAIAARTPAN